MFSPTLLIEWATRGLELKELKILRVASQVVRMTWSLQNLLQEESLPRFCRDSYRNQSCIRRHKRVFSDRDRCFYWVYALGSFGVGFSLFFITPRSGVRA